jgi:hypothetical protein
MLVGYTGMEKIGGATRDPLILELRNMGLGAWHIPPWVVALKHRAVQWRRIFIVVFRIFFCGPLLDPFLYKPVSLCAVPIEP